ncbi:MAG: hypothetical protein AVDCRST_MAG87-1617, partial [uncultured Thermomicrobiales bacterium]
VRNLPVRCRGFGRFRTRLAAPLGLLAPLAAPHYLRSSPAAGSSARPSVARPAASIRRQCAAQGVPGSSLRRWNSLV